MVKFKYSVMTVNVGLEEREEAHSGQEDVVLQSLFFFDGHFKTFVETGTAILSWGFTLAL